MNKLEAITKITNRTEDLCNIIHSLPESAVISIVTELSIHIKEMTYDENMDLLHRIRVDCKAELAGYYECLGRLVLRYDITQLGAERDTAYGLCLYCDDMLNALNRVSMGKCHLAEEIYSTTVTKVVCGI